MLATVECIWGKSATQISISCQLGWIWNLLDDQHLSLLVKEYLDEFSL